jgi:predicted TIM-barrel fold metal-dependent hydrolase
MSQDNRPIIDPHIHFWDQRKTPRETSGVVRLLGWHRGLLHGAARLLFPKDAFAFFGRPDYILADYLPGDYAQDTSTGSQVGYVHVEASWRGRGPMGPVEETRWLEKLGDPRLLGIVGHADLSLGAGVEPVLAAHVAASPRFRGVRQTLSHHHDTSIMNGCDKPDLLLQPEWRRGYAALATQGLSFEATVYHHQLPDLAELAEGHPEVPVVLCHAATPAGIGGPFGRLGSAAEEREITARQWRRSMTRLADLPHVSCKISGLLMPILGWGFHDAPPADADRIVTKLRPLVDFLIETFGAQRCMFASNFPVDKVSTSWETLYEAFSALVAHRSQEEQRALFHDTAARVYRLET